VLPKYGTFAYVQASERNGSIWIYDTARTGRSIHSNTEKCAVRKL